MTTKSVRARPKLDREVVVTTALTLADTEGLDAVTIRRLAQELSVTPMALYWHFRDKDALIAGIADRVWVEAAATLHVAMAATDPTGEDGWAPVRTIVVALVDVMRRHPAVAALTPIRVLECEPGLQLTELLLDLLETRGFDLHVASAICRYVLCSAIMLVTNQPGNELTGRDDIEEHLRHKRVALASLPPGRYARVVASADDFTRCLDPDADFALAVDLIVAGVRSQAPAVRRRRRTAPARGAASAHRTASARGTARV